MVVEENTEDFVVCLFSNESSISLSRLKALSDSSDLLELDSSVDSSVELDFVDLDE